MTKRALFAAVAVLLCRGDARAEPPSDPLNWLGGPIAPHLFAYDLDDRGLPRYPFDPLNDSHSGKGANLAVRTARQFTEGSRQAMHVDGSLRFIGRLGADFRWSRFDVDAFKLRRRTDRLALHATADLSETEGQFLEYGFGVATFQGEQTFWGPSLEFMGERRLAKPWTLYARYAYSLMSRGLSFHELSGGAGVSWKRLGLEAGYRGFLNPLRNVYGPEVAVRLWW